VLSQPLLHAQIVRAGSLAEGVELLRSAQADLLASQKPALLQIADQVPGSRLLEGNFGIEDHAIGIPKDRSRALPFLREFVEEAIKASGGARR
jgi:polar amino acid transport system substrate-binding protein